MSKQWWGRPFDARRYHIFEGEGFTESLCGSWMLRYDGNDPEVKDDDEFKDGRDCKQCSRKAGVLSE